MISISGYSILRLLRRVVFVWAVEVLGLWLLARLLPGLEVQGVPTAAWAVVVISLLNAVVRPVIILLTLPFTVLTFGFLILVLNAFILIIAGRLVQGLTVSDPLTAILAAFGLTAINTFFAAVFSLNDEDSVYRNIVRRIAGRGVPPETHDKPGLIIIEIDGLSAPVFETALDQGYLPTLYQWLRRGSHKLAGWDCGLPSQTSSSQAGILHGNNFDIPAFRWFEKETGRMMVSNRPNDATEIEKRISSGEGLLSENGYSFGNMISGDAKISLLTLSTMGDPARHVREGYGGYFYCLVNPYHFTRVLVLSVWEMVVELWQGARQRLADIKPRVARGGSFPLLRAASTVYHREINASLLMAEMFGGASMAYASFVGYDVLAHHTGPTHRDALRHLLDIDRKIAMVARAAEDAPRPYYFVILSDHGQSFGATFKQRYGTTLEQLVQSLLTGDRTVRTFGGTNEEWGHLNALLSEAAQYGGVAGRTIRRMLRRRMHDGYIDLEPPDTPEERRVKILRRRKAPPPPPPPDPASVTVCVSGNLGLIYFADVAGRVPFEKIAEDYPGLLEGMVGHPGIGFLLVHSESHGPLVLGKDGVRYLKDNRIDGKDPLEHFGPRAADHLRRLDTFPHTGDIVVNSACDPLTDEVAAFEELIGSHGGLGGPQTDAFIVYPTAWGDEDIEITNSNDIYWLLRRWSRKLS